MSYFRLTNPRGCAIIVKSRGKKREDNKIGESYSGSIAVSKTVHGGSNPSSPALLKHLRVFGDVFLLPGSGLRDDRIEASGALLIELVEKLSENSTKHQFDGDHWTDFSKIISGKF